jgi:hypothetical protein
MLWNALPLEFHNAYSFAPPSSSFSWLPAGYCTCSAESDVLLLLLVTRGSKVGSAVLDATLGEAQVGRDEILGIGIAEDRPGDRRLVLVESEYVTPLTLEEWWIGRRKEHRKKQCKPVHGRKKRVSIGGVLRLDAPPEISRGQGKS